MNLRHVTTREPWHVRWKAARKIYFSSAEKLADALNASGCPGVTRFTAQRWEWPRPKGSRPTKYRQALAAMNDDFAVLMDELDQREREEDVLRSEDLPGHLEGLAERVARLADALTQLAEAQRPALRDQLLRTLAGERE